MKTRFIPLLLSLFVGASAYAQAPTSPKVVILELEMSRGITNNAIARDDFRKLSADELLAAPLKGERPSNLSALFGCNDMDAACLKQVSTSLQARFILFGSLTLSGTKEKFLVSLYDADANQIIATEETSFLVENRATEMQKTIQKVLRAPGAALIRKPQPLEKPIPLEKPTPTAKSGKWKYALPVAFGAAALGMGARSLSLESNLTEDGERSADEDKQIKTFAVSADVLSVIAIGSGAWALLSNKKNKQDQGSVASSQ